MADILKADAHLARDVPGERPIVDVAVGVLLQADGRFLLTSRPAGKVYAGYWEFPGGKLEAGRTRSQRMPAVSALTASTDGLADRRAVPWVSMR